MGIDWDSVKRVLVVRLRSIGDTVLATPSLIALRRALPGARIDILLEDWVAPLLSGFEAVDDVITVGKGNLSRLGLIRRLRRERYDVVFNLHGGTTSTFLTAASGARHRVGYRTYQYSFLYDHRCGPAADFWGASRTHSAEQQLALIGSVGISVDDPPGSSLPIAAAALETIEKKLGYVNGEFTCPGFALFHPAAAFATKQWPVSNFARAAEHLASKGIVSIAVASKNESGVLLELEKAASVPIKTFDYLTLPEITALASKALMFVGNDSGIAHIAAAVGTPCVVVFGSSNRDHWSPWDPADAVPHEVVFEEFDCQPCPGYRCEVYGEPRCILYLRAEKALAAIDRVLANSNKG